MFMLLNPRIVLTVWTHYYWFQIDVFIIVALWKRHLSLCTAILVDCPMTLNNTFLFLLLWEKQQRKPVLCVHNDSVSTMSSLHLWCPPEQHLARPSLALWDSPNQKHRCGGNMRLFYRCFDFVPKEFGVIPLYDNCVCGYKTQITPCPNKTEFSVKPAHSVPHPRITHLLERLLYFVKKCKSIIFGERGVNITMLPCIHFSKPCIAFTQCNLRNTPNSLADLVAG